MEIPGQAHIIVTGNEKGGSGKSTTAMHLIVGLMRAGHSVAAIDLDTRQGTLRRYILNRQAFTEDQKKDLPMPVLAEIEPSTDVNRDTAEVEDEENLTTTIAGLSATSDIVVIDTPGADSSLSRLGHSLADTLVTPLNDSFVDLDVLARIDGRSLNIDKPSHYAEMVWQQKMRRAKRDGGSIDWIVMRNRLSSLDARNKREMQRLLGDLSDRIGFRQVPGFGERVIFRELFLVGLTMLDLLDVLGEDSLTLSHVAARQEVRNLIDAVGL
ncbi:MAG: AAA family ATPase [Rhodospirillaceae bacterium]|nr:AAA family ATPase [Rhodospirillaceae bacterium]